MRLVALAIAITLLATAASAQTGPAETPVGGPGKIARGAGAGSPVAVRTPAGPEFKPTARTLKSRTPSSSNRHLAAGPAQRLRDYTTCRTKRGYPVNTQTPSDRELRACQSQLRRDAQKDTHTAIRVVFNEADWPAAICIVDHEGGRWNRAAGVGAAGEITSWQWHPGWWKPGHTFNGGAPVLDEQRLRESALYATRAARRLWERSGRTFRVHWVNTSRKCGL